jgi:hypothetical protein
MANFQRTHNDVVKAEPTTVAYPDISRTRVPDVEGIGYRLRTDHRPEWAGSVEPKAIPKLG